MPKKILLVDDNPPVIAICQDYLKASGYDVVTATDGLQGLAAARQEKPDLIVLDLILPDMDGLDVCRAIRSESNVPIIILTWRVEESERVTGLAIGADDYMTKPFSPRELVARVGAVLRRAGSDLTSDMIRVGSVSLDRARFEVRIEQRKVPLTPIEFEIMATLMSQPGRTFSRSQLFTAAHGIPSDRDGRAIDSQIHNLRHKLNPHKLIFTVQGAGYQFYTPEEHRFGTV